MKKTVFLLTFLLIILAGVYIIFDSYNKEATLPVETIEDNNDTNIDNEEEGEKSELFVLMNEIGLVFDDNQNLLQTEAVVAWNSNSEPTDGLYLGTGYSIENGADSETLRGYCNSINDLLREKGFETDAYNATSSFTTRYKKDDIVCNLTDNETEEEGAVSMKISCADINNPLVLTDEKKEESVGGQRDEYGCLNPAGYSWDSEVSACIRSWELSEDQKKAVKVSVDAIGWEDGLTVSDVMPIDCIGCYTVNFSIYERSKRVEVDNWEVIDIVEGDFE